MPKFFSYNKNNITDKIFSDFINEILEKKPKSLSKYHFSNRKEVFKCLIGYKKDYKEGDDWGEYDLRKEYFSELNKFIKRQDFESIKKYVLENNSGKPLFHHRYQLPFIKNFINNRGYIKLLKDLFSSKITEDNFDRLVKKCSKLFGSAKANHSNSAYFLSVLLTAKYPNIYVP